MASSNVFPTVIRIVESLSEYDTTPTWWGSLYQTACNSSIFLSSEWIDSWLQYFGEEFLGHWVHWEHEGSVVGGVLVVSRRTGSRFLGFQSVFLNGTGITRNRAPFAEYNDVLCVQGFEQSIALDLAEFLKGLHWDRFFASGYVAGGVLSRVVEQLPAVAVDLESKPSPYVDLTTLRAGEYEGSIAANTRSQIRRCRRIYEAKRGTVSLSRADTLSGALEYLAQLAALHNARWAAKGVSGSFAYPTAAQFHRQLIMKLWEQGAVDLVRVRAGEKAIGFLYNFVHRGKVYFFQSGFAYETDAKVKPGLLTHALAIESYVSRGMHDYDFLAGECQYKRSLAKGLRMLHWTTVHRGGWMTEVFLLARKLKNALREQVS